MAEPFCVSLSKCRLDGDAATLAFVVANAAVGSGKRTVVFVSTDGVWAAVKGEAEKINEGAPFAPLKELVDKFVAAGGEIWVCIPCMKKREIADDMLIEGAKPVGGAILIELLSGGTPCISY